MSQAFDCDHSDSDHFDHAARSTPETDGGPQGSLSFSSPALQGLDPELQDLLAQFVRLTQIQRPSGSEEQIREYLASLAQQNGWEHKVDQTGNIVIYVPGAGMGMNAEPVALQAHMDMVCVPAGMQEIVLRREQRKVETDGKNESRDLLTADGTTLGADNGIGIAAMLAVACRTEGHHPPLQLVFTVNEEVDLAGAFGLDTSLVTARQMINLDSEEHGIIYISSAGGQSLEAKWRLARVPPQEGARAVKIRLDGFLGGHSGAEIHKPVGNPLVTLLSLLGTLEAELGREAYQLSSLSGGQRSNVIPSEAEAVIWVPADEKTAAGFLPVLLPAMGAWLQRRRIELADTRNIRISIEPCGDALFPIEQRQRDEILPVLQAVGDTHGALVFSDTVPGLVETSNNLAILATGVESMSITTMARSSRAGATSELNEHLQNVLRSGGAEVTLGTEFPLWEADPENPLLVQAQQTFERVTGAAPKVAGIHAGLECGVLAGRCPGLKVVSLGPDLLSPHSTREALILDTLPEFWRFFTGLMEDLSRQPEIA